MHCYAPSSGCARRLGSILRACCSRRRKRPEGRSDYKTNTTDDGNSERRRPTWVNACYRLVASVGRRNRRSVAVGRRQTEGRMCEQDLPARSDCGHAGTAAPLWVRSGAKMSYGYKPSYYSEEEKALIRGPWFWHAGPDFPSKPFLISTAALLDDGREAAKPSRYSGNSHQRRVQRRKRWISQKS